MRTVVRVAAVLPFLALAACSDGTGPDDPTESHTLSGVVLDSLANAPVEGATVSAAGRSSTTDFLGAYTLPDVPGGTVTVQVAAEAFDPANPEVEVTSDRTLNVRLRRRAPYLLNLDSDGRNVAARWIDLQEDFPSGQVGIAAHTSTSTWVCYNLGRNDLSDQERVYFFECPGTRIVAWMEDEAGHRSEFECFAGGACEEVRPED